MTFKSKCGLALICAAIMLLALLPAAALADGGFDDVAEDAWYAEDVQYAVDRGLMQGMGGGLFAPDDLTTRAQLVTVLYRLEGSPEITGDSFDDVSAEDYFFKPVEWAAATDIVSGYGDRRFGPNDTLTREQFATLLYRFAEFKGYDVSATRSIAGYLDYLVVSDWADKAVRWAVATGLLKGNADRLDPAGPATRAQMAAILHRFCDFYLTPEEFDPEKAYAGLLQTYKAVVSGEAAWDEALGSPEFFNRIPGYDAPAAGYAFLDLNSDGKEELLIGPVDLGGSPDWYRGLLYALYTYDNGKPVKLCESWERNRYYLLTDNKLENDWSNGADDSGTDYYMLLNGDNQLSKCRPYSVIHRDVVYNLFSFDPAQAYAELLQKYKAVVSGEAAWDEALGSPEFFGQVPGFDAPEPGYAFIDINGDGEEELAIGPLDMGGSEEFNKGLLYALYTYENGQPVKLCESRERDRFYLLTDGRLSNPWSNGATDSGVDYYELKKGGAGLTPCDEISSPRRAVDFKAFAFDPAKAYGDLLQTYKAVLSGEAAWDDALGSPEFFGQIPGFEAPKAGYAFVDLNADGKQELIIAPTDYSTSEEWYRSLIYVLYTYDGEKPVQLCQSVVRGRYYLLADGQLSFYWSNGASDSGIDCYKLAKGARTLTLSTPTTGTRQDITVKDF